MRGYSRSNVTVAFGPGPMTPAVKAIVFTNVGVFLISLFAPNVSVALFGLTPSDVLGRGFIWQPVTYLFLHSTRDLTHILFNMLSVWMFGVDLERRWGTQAFVRYYFVTGIGAAITMLLVSLLPFDATRSMYGIPTIGASGAVYGLILAWALLFPHRQILFMFLFPLPARVFAAIMAAIAFLAAFSGSGGGIAHFTHLGGLIAGWLYLKGPHDLGGELRYRLTRWRMERLRRRFDVHRGGRDRDQWRIH